MKTTNVLMASTASMFFLIVFSFAQSFAQPAVMDDEQAIRKVIQTAYVDGLQNWGDIEAIRAGFHPTFELLTKTRDNQISKLPIGEWIERVEKNKADHPSGPEFLTVADIKSLDITEDAASVKLDLIRNKKRIFTDYLLLYKFEEGWRIVGKIYYRIPQ